MRRRTLVALFLVALVFPITGCRQTTGPIAGGPIAAGPLSPINPGQRPILGPFGSNTRVTPPATGSYQGINNYTGASVAPIARPSLGVASGNPALGPVGSIGTGVQVAGWTETNATIANSTNDLPSSSFGTNPSAGDPRSGGMRVNDLTGAPAPPGYRPIHSPSPAQYLSAGQYPPADNGSTAPIAFNPVPLSLNRVTAAPQQGWQGLTPAPVQNFTPATPTTSLPVQASLPVQGPSTEPVDSKTGSTNLNWRRPGSQF